MANSRADKDNKERQEKYQNILGNLLRDDDNKYCVDCDAKGPRWASWNLGIFLCIRCAGIHRNLGVHISKVKSVTLDTWTSEQIAMVQEMGNSRARAVYEANLPDSFRRPQTDSGLEAFIRAKYEQKKYIAAEWVPPKPKALVRDIELVKSDPPMAQIRSASQANLRPVLDDEPGRGDRKARPRSTVANMNVAPLRITDQIAGSKSSAAPPPVRAEPQARAVEVPISQQKAPEIDLLGLETPAISSSVKSDDLFSEFLSASSGGGTALHSSTLPHTNGGGAEQHGGGGELSGVDMVGMFDGSESKPASTKDAIMALYGPSTGAMGSNPYGGAFMPAGQPQMVMVPPPGGMMGMMPGGGGMMMQPMMMGPGGMPMMGMPVQGMGMQAQGGGGGQMMMGGGNTGMGPPQGMYNVQPAMYNLHQVQNQMASMNLMTDHQAAAGGQYRQTPNVAPVPQMPGAGWGAQHPVYPVAANMWQ